MKNSSKISINLRVQYLKFIILGLFAIFLIRVIYIAVKDTKLPPSTKTIRDRALRGSIISSEGYTISRSIKKYSASIHTAYIDPKKRDFFITMFSIYTNIPKRDVEKKFYTKSGKAKKGWITLADNIDAKTAIFLKDLKHKLNRLKVFRAIGVNKNFYYGLTITQVGESREYPLKEALSPILGYTREKKINGYTQIVGYNGIEKYYEKFLNKKQDGLIKGKRDVLGYVVYNNKTKIRKKENGFNLVLNINLGLQKNIDMILDYYKENFDAKEIIAAVMRSEDSKIIAITSSNRYNPLDIKKDEIANLQPKATTYAYEPGSVLKPIVYAIALEHKIISPNTVIDTMGGRMRLAGRTVTDDEKFASLKALDIIVHSSNIGIAKIAWKLGRRRFREGILSFGLGSKKSGIDIGRETLGKIFTLNQLRIRSNLGTSAYGYGIKATFAQLIKAYNVFNNNGSSLSPRVVNYLKKENNDTKYIVTKDYKQIQPISPETSDIVKKTLIEVVNRGTGKLAKTKGLIVGGKTGTAMIFRNGEYSKNYHTSFFGFANDFEGHKYTIGVLVIEPSFKYHFASKSAVPVFKKIVDALVERKFLKPNISKEEKAKKERLRVLREKRLKAKQVEKTKELKKKLKREREKELQKEQLKKLNKAQEEIKRKKAEEKRRKELQKEEELKRKREEEAKKLREEKLKEERRKAKEKREKEERERKRREAQKAKEREKEKEKPKPKVNEHKQKIIEEDKNLGIF
jgi:cell division protein FtsI (penicillin-binding protein 3)